MKDKLGFCKKANDKFTVDAMSKQSRKGKMVPKTKKQTNKNSTNNHIRLQKNMVYM